MDSTGSGFENGARGNDPTKEFRLLLAFFGQGESPKARFVKPDEIPSPYRELLVHNGHMTETLERYHGTPVLVHPYEIHQHGSMYGRKLDLAIEPDGRVVMTGMMIFNLSVVREEIQQEILAGRIPLGRILISHGVLREVSAGAFLEFAAEDPLATRFVDPSHPSPPRPVYGRLATILCDGKPAVDLLEIVAP